MTNVKRKLKQQAKTFDTIKQANHYQERLYNKFDLVRLVKAPMFSEQGIYVWEIGVINS